MRSPADNRRRFTFEIERMADGREADTTSPIFLFTSNKEPLLLGTRADDDGSAADRMFHTLRRST